MLHTVYIYCAGDELFFRGLNSPRANSWRRPKRRTWELAERFPAGNDERWLERMDFSNQEGDWIVAPVRCCQDCGLRRHGAGSNDHSPGRAVHAKKMREIQVQQANRNGQHAKERKGLWRNLFVHDLRRWNSLVLLLSCYLWKICKRMGCDYRLFANGAKNLSDTRYS